MESAGSTSVARYGVELTAEAIGRLGRYYKILKKWNPRMHLVAPCSPEEFAQRHVLESLMLLPHLSQGARVADIGSGAGLPIIPCLIARPDLNAILIESSTKKAVFLREALSVTQKAESARVIADRFENIPAPDVSFITSRALDRFAETLPRLLEWSPPSSTLLLFGGEALRPQLQNSGRSYTEIHVPGSEKRFLFVIEGTAAAST
ncbi:MAG: 16S rRNA (guanine(527)-N(7))-methyltransferase RsmG [Acidobacteriota bacterium]